MKLTSIFTGFILLALICGEATAQQVGFGEFKRQVYTKEFYGGINFNSRGYGAFIRRLNYIDGYNKIGGELELAYMRHPKEMLPTAFGTNNIVHNKINSLYTLRLGFGQEKILIDKTDQGSLAINWTIFGGASIGLLKPVFIEVRRQIDDGSRIQVTSIERYDPPNNQPDDSVPFLVGIGETQAIPGVYLKNGVSFDYNFFDEKVTALEVGVIFDYFFREVPIMYDTRNYRLWWQIYLTFNFGNKWN